MVSISLLMGVVLFALAFLAGAVLLAGGILLVALVIAFMPERDVGGGPAPDLDRTERMPAYYRQVNASSTTIRLRRRHYVP